MLFLSPRHVTQDNYRQKGQVCWLSGRKEGSIRVILPEGMEIPDGDGEVRVSGKLSADPENSAYPYLMKAEKIEALRKD